MRRRVEPGLPVRIDDRFSLIIRARLCARERRRHLVEQENRYGFFLAVSSQGAFPSSFWPSNQLIYGLPP